MIDGAIEHIGDGLDAPMWMPWKPAQVLIGNVIAKVVKQQERVKLARIMKAESAVQVHACAFHGGGGFAGFQCGSQGHGGSGLSGVGGAA